MKVTVLGCGWSMGIPIIGCDCAVCTSTNPKNKRRRVSVFVEVDGVNLLIDTAPDLRLQALDNKITRLDAVLYTHDHYDHSGGLDDLRRFCGLQKEKIKVYGSKQTLESLKIKHSHAFSAADMKPEWFKLYLEPYTVRMNKPFKIKGVEIKPFPQIHGRNSSIGYRIGNFAYSTDVNNFSDACFDNYLSGLDLWVVDCQSYSPGIAHSDVARTLQWIKRVNPKRAILTHMGHEIEYEKIKSELPLGVEPGYDGMEIEL